MLKVLNKTQWATRDLRRIFSAVLRDSNKWEGKLNGAVRVTVVHSRTGSFSGYAYLNSTVMRLRVPTPDSLKGAALDVFKLAYLFEHELAHCRGYVHEDMVGLNSWKCATETNYRYVAGMTVAAKPPPKAKPKADVQVTRYLRVVAGIDKRERERAKLERALSKLAAKRRYYERVLAVDGRLAALNKPTKEKER